MGRPTVMIGALTEGMSGMTYLSSLGHAGNGCAPVLCVPTEEGVDQVANV